MNLCNVTVSIKLLSFAYLLLRLMCLERQPLKTQKARTARTVANCPWSLSPRNRADTSWQTLKVSPSSSTLVMYEDWLSGNSVRTRTGLHSQSREQNQNQRMPMGPSSPSSSCLIGTRRKTSITPTTVGNLQER